MTPRRLPPVYSLTWVRLLAATVVAYSLLLGGVTGGPATSSAQENSPKVADNEPTPVEYRRIFVPTDNIDAWPDDGEKFLPIESREFDAWVAAANRDGNRRPGSVTIEEAEYAGRFENGRVSGRGQWRIDLHDGPKAFLPLTTSLAIRDAHWQTSAAPIAAAQLPAQLGAWGRDGAALNEFGLAVSKPGTLQFIWTAPVRSARDGWEVPWQLPIATTTRVLLDLPEGQRPHMDGGIVHSSSRPASNEPGGELLRRWDLRCPASRHAILRIVEERPAKTIGATNVSLHEEVVYKLSARGLEMTATWTLIPTGGDPTNELVVLVPRALQLISVVADGAELPGRSVDRASEQQARILFRLPAASKDRPLQVVLRASRPLVLDRPWKLPQLRPEGVFWTSGDVQLAVDDALELRALNAVGCVETGVNELSGGADHAETWRLAVYSDNASVEVQVARRAPDATVALGTSLVMADSDITGKLVSQWNVTQGKVHRLLGELAPGWVIETVETVPSEALGEWFINQRDERRYIDIQLASGVRPERGVTVVISGRLPRSRYSDRISANRLRIVTWQGARVAKHLLAFEPSEPFALEPVGNLPKVELDSLKGIDEALLDANAASASLFDLSSEGETAGVELTAKQGKFAADVSVSISVTGQQLLQKNRVVVRPISNRIDRVLIAATQTLGDDVHWSDPAAGSTISAQRLSTDDPRAAGLPAGSELWLVNLPKPSAAPMEIMATQTHDHSRRSIVPLLSLPEAIEQRGRIVLQAGFDLAPTVDALGMSAVPLPAPPPDPSAEAWLPTRAAYRYDPADCLEPTRTPRLAIAPSQGGGLSGLVARGVVLESYFSVNGDVRHRATYSLSNDGATAFEWRLPPDAKLESISVNGLAVPSAVASTSPASKSARLVVPTGSSTVTISFSTRQEPLSIGSRLAPPLVLTDVPLLAGEWNIWLPEEYAIAKSDAPNWRERLFGPLGRPDGARTFQPLRASHWMSILNSFAISWRLSEWQSDSLAGWHSERIHFVADGPSAVRIAHPSTTTAWATSLLLLSLVGGMWLARRSKKWLYALLAAAGCMAFLLPAAMAQLAAGAVWGLLLSLVMPWPRPRDTQMGASTHWHRFSTMGAVWIVATGCFAGFACAQDEDSASADENVAQPRAIHRVFVPVDVHGRQAGTKYYVSERFARELLRSTMTDPMSERRWLLRSIAYAGELREQVEKTGIIAGEFTITCDLEVLARDTVVVLPFAQGDATWPSFALLDGIPLPITWLDGKRGCTVQVAEPGRYSLVFSLVPHTTVAHGRNVVKLSSQPMPGATLRIEQPPELVGLTVLGTRATPTESNAKSSEYVLNDGSNHLELQWPAAEVTHGTRAVRVTELEWMRIDEAGVELTTKFVFEGNLNQAEPVVVAFDAAWNLVQDDIGANKVKINPGSDDRKTIRVELSASGSERKEVVLHWRPVVARPLGRLYLSPIELVSHSASQRWRAISSTTAIECEITDDGATSGTAEEFVALWGGTGQTNTPQFVLGNIQPRQPWNVSTRPRPIESDIAQVLHVAAGRRELRIAYQADIVPGTAQRHRFPLIVPAETSTLRVAAIQGGRRIPLRWSRAGADRINVFFGEQLSEKYRLELSGTVPATGDELSLPLVGVADTDRVTTVQLYRGDDVELNVHGLSGEDQSLRAPLEPPPDAWTARQIAGYRLDKATAAKVRLQVKANEPRLEGDSLATLARTVNGWTGSFQIDGTVKRGILDGITLHLPANWGNSPTLQSSTPAALSVVSRDEQRVTLAIRFVEAIPSGSPLKLKIDAPLAFERDVSIPHITMTPAIVGRRYVRMPSQLDGRPVTWTGSGVKAAELPVNLRAADDASKNVQTFECTAEAIHLTLQPRKDAPDAARARLADIVASLDHDGRRVMTTHFIIEPQGLADCTLRLPLGQQLVAVRLTGQPALIQQVNPENWRVSLGPPQLPSILEVTTRDHERRSSGEQLEIRRPALFTGGRPIPVDINLWYVEYPSTMRPPTIGATAQATAAEHAVLRFEQMLSTAEAASATAAQMPAPDGYLWFRPWSFTLNRLRREAKEATANPDGRQAPSQVSQPADEQLAAASARLDAWLEKCNTELAGKAAEKSLPEIQVAEPDSPPADAISAADRRLYCVTDGALDRLTLDDNSSSSRDQTPILGVLAIAGLWISAVVLSHRTGALEFVYRWPHAVGFLLGIAWWAWLRPSWCGLVIAAACVALAIRAGWPGRTILMDASTVVRSGHAK